MIGSLNMRFLLRTFGILLTVGLFISQTACSNQDSESAKLVQTFKLSYYPTHVAWHPDGQRLATIGFSGGLSVWDIPTGKQVATQAMKASEFSVAYSPDGRFLAVSKATSLRGERVDYLVVMDAKNYEVLYEYPPKGEPMGPAFAMAFSPDGRYLIAGAASRMVVSARILDVESKSIIGSLISSNKLDSIQGIVYPSDGATVITGHISGKLNIWSVKDMHLIKTIQAHKGYILSMAISPDGKWLATGSNSSDVDQRYDPATRITTEIKYDDPIKIFDTTTWEQVKALPVRNKHTTSLAFLPDSAHLVSAAQENILFWDVQSEKQIGSINGFKGGSALDFALSQDGKNLAVVGTGSSEVQVWKISNQLTNKQEK